MTLQRSPVLQVNALTKAYGANTVLSDINLTFFSGEIHTLFGGNGAGKSTLVKILSGALLGYSGSITLNGQAFTPSSPLDASKQGVSTVFQDFSLVPTLSVLDNLFLGKEIIYGPFLNRQRMRRLAKARLQQLGLDFALTLPVSYLDRASQQLLEIAKAIFSDADVLILDEPTSSLTARETETLFRLTTDFKNKGGAVLFISHKLSEIIEYSDKISILRDGTLLSTLRVADHPRGDLPSLVTGIDPGLKASDHSKPHGSQEICLEVSALSIRDRVHDLSFAIHRGEILAITGLAGSGLNEVGRGLFGLAELRKGTVTLYNEPITSLNPRSLLATGVMYVPSDRSVDALLSGQPIIDNLSITAISKFSGCGGLLNKTRRRSMCTEIAKELKLKYHDLSDAIETLSGGNQQKVVLGRCLLAEYKLLIMDEPTIGVDMETKQIIYWALRRLAAKGVGILLLSTDFEEIKALADTVLVLHQGRLAYSSGDVAELSEDVVNSAAFGLMASNSPEELRCHA